MPQASDELRALIASYFPDNGDEHWSALDPSASITFLEQSGWTVDDRFIIHPPKDKPKETLSDKEWDCVDFLIQEWDYGYDPG